MRTGREFRLKRLNGRPKEHISRASEGQPGLLHE